MPHFTEQARTYSECLEKIKAKYGKDFKVLIERTVRKGGLLGLGSHEEVEMTGTYGFAPQAPADLETAKRQVLAAAGRAAPSSDIQTVLKEIASLSGAIKSLNEKVDESISPPAARAVPPEISSHPSLQKLEEDLLFNEFTPSFIKTILERARREFPLEELEDYEEVQRRVILWIGGQIRISPEPEQPLQAKKKSRIIVLLGPPGVGKTTTLVKLAALYGERDKGVWKKQIRLVTLDRYRIGAEYQLEKFGEVMNIPVSVVEDFDGLKKVLALYRQSADFILVDTIGKSPRNYVDLGKMKVVLDACPAKTEFHLCIQASTKGGDIREILRQFESFKYKSVIVTKLDETNSAGNVISVLAEEQKPVSFITTGQTVPSDIERATIIRFLINLEGFSIDRSALVDHFRGV